MMDDGELDFERDLEEVRSGVQNYRTGARNMGFSATVIGQYAATEAHSLPGGAGNIDYEDEFNGKSHVSDDGCLRRYDKRDKGEI